MKPEKVTVLNKIALITGGSSGLGLAMAKYFQVRGYELILLARNSDKLHTVKVALSKISSTSRIHIYPCDVSDEQELIKIFKEINATFTTIDFLVLNAGVATIDLLSDYETLSEVTHNIKINLLGVVSTTYLCMPLLKPGAHILFIASGFGLIGPAGYSLYATAKAGIINFSEAMRREMLNRKVMVHLSCPGDIDTPMLQGELEIMPTWMKNKMGRAKPKNAEKVANYILNKCFKGRFMIIPSVDVTFLMIVQKLLPRTLSTFLIDKILPLPPKVTIKNKAITAKNEAMAWHKLRVKPTKY